MSFVSTAGRCAPATFREALLSGLAPDGGLYVPQTLPPFPETLLEAVRECRPAEAAYHVLRHLIPRDDIPDDHLRDAMRDALDFEIPLVQLDDRLWILELFHGPTLAFKDVGARCMARLMRACRPPDDGVRTILVATSGDTGGAVANAFWHEERTRVVVLYPLDRVSPVQAKQFTTLGDNVTAAAVRGTFDDCQRLAKAAFANPELSARYGLTSANSINIGRLLPQIVYYVYARAQLPADGRSVICSVPSGNLGNLCAGLMAKRMGTRIEWFAAPTNRNRAFADVLDGSYDPNRPAVPTISSAMDVAAPSNLERILWLYEQDIPRLRRDVLATWHTDEATRTAIRDVHQRFGYLMDPHTAVGYLGLQEALPPDSDAVGVVLATAHPAKFADVVQPMVASDIQMPVQLAACLDRPDTFEVIDPDLNDLLGVLEAA